MCSQGSQSQKPESLIKKKLSQVLEEEDERETLEMSQVVWDTDNGHGDDDSEVEDNWDDLDKTLMEDFAKNLTTSADTRDIEDLMLDSE